MIQDLLLRNDEVFDVAEQEWTSKLNILDSVPAVTEAVENSISIASLLGTLGGIVSFDRDLEADRREQVLDRDFNKAIGGN